MLISFDSRGTDCVVGGRIEISAKLAHKNRYVVNRNLKVVIWHEEGCKDDSGSTTVSNSTILIKTGELQTALNMFRAEHHNKT